MHVLSPYNEYAIVISRSDACCSEADLGVRARLRSLLFLSFWVVDLKLFVKSHHAANKVRLGR